jgi:hypothetical protein
MPDGVKSYKTKQGVFEIPQKEYQSFLKDFPDAVEIQSFKLDNDTFDIPVHEVEGFLKENPQAQSLKKKVGGQGSGISASPTQSQLQLPKEIAANQPDYANVGSFSTATAPVVNHRMKTLVIFYKAKIQIANLL